MRPLVAVLVLALFLVSCVSTNFVKLGSGPTYGPVPVDSVVVYRTASQVPGKYEEIALLNSAGSSGWTNEAQMIKSMRKEASKLGANGIILDALSEPGAGAKVAAAIFGTSAERKGRAIAVRVLRAPE